MSKVRKITKDATINKTIKKISSLVKKQVQKEETN